MQDAQLGVAQWALQVQVAVPEESAQVPWPLQVLAEQAGRQVPLLSLSW
jgi:hypothetical protein